jgi:hypothetical protein
MNFREGGREVVIQSRHDMLAGFCEPGGEIRDVTDWLGANCLPRKDYVPRVMLVCVLV